jgi:hypothetical protein
MSFTCQGCGVHQPAGIKPIVKVVETRKVTYDMGVDEEDGIENEPSRGWEIVKEIKLCRGCAEC